MVRLRRTQGPLLTKGSRYLNKVLKVVKLSMKRCAVLSLLLAWPLFILGPHEGGGTTPDGAVLAQGESAPALNQNGPGPGSSPSLHSAQGQALNQNGAGQAQADGRPGGGDYEEADILEEGLPIMIEGGKASSVGPAESATPPDKRGGGNPPQVEGHTGGKVSERKGE